MKKFVADKITTYYWNCPYCGRICTITEDDPSEYECVTCEYCGEESECVNKGIL